MKFIWIGVHNLIKGIPDEKILFRGIQQYGEAIEKLSKHYI